MNILGIDTSCDDTSAGIVADERRVLSNVIHSQVQLHHPHGGVVPELASREHLRNIMPVVREALLKADLRMEDLDGIGVLEHVASKSEKTKVIFITGYATVENAREALVKGAFDFIAKPFKVNDLRMAITKAALSLGYMGAVSGAPA